MLLKDGISLRYLSLYKSNTADLSAYKIPVGGSLGAYFAKVFLCAKLMIVDNNTR